MDKLKLLSGLLGVLFVATGIMSISQFNTINDIEEEFKTAAEGFEPNYKCDDRGLEFYCISMSSTMKTCYTLPDRKGGKRCLVEPFWEEIVIEYDITCPDTPDCQVCQICQEVPDPIVCPEDTTPYERCNSCCGGGGGGSCPSCPSCRLGRGIRTSKNRSPV